MKAQLNQTIEITLKPSMLLLGLLSTIAIVSALILAMLPIPFWLKLLLMALVVFSTLYYILRDSLLLLPWSWRHLEVNHTGELMLTNQQGQQFMPALCATTLVHPSVIILNTERVVSKFGLLHKLPSLMLLSSMSTQEQHRRLRVWLRWWQHSKNQPM